MSRVFKIRVWDAEKNRWFYTVPGEPDDHNVLATWHFDEVESHGDRHIWEQYTDLKDKNGKEIYEGDIVVVMGYGTYKVFWREWDSSFSLMPIGTIKEETRVLMLCEDWENDYEVIGNIHENPELLEGAK